MAGSTTFLLILHFYTGGVVHRYHGWETGALKVSVFSHFVTILRPLFLFLHLLYNELLAVEKKGEWGTLLCSATGSPVRTTVLEAEWRGDLVRSVMASKRGEWGGNNSAPVWSWWAGGWFRRVGAVGSVRWRWKRQLSREAELWWSGLWVEENS